MERPFVRPGTAADAPAISRLGIETFRETYGESFPAAATEAFLVQNHSLDAVLRHLEEPQSFYLVAAGEAGLEGYALFQDSDLPEGFFTPVPAVELVRFYVRRTAQGKGLGRAMLDAALAECARRRYQTIWLRVWERNESARAIYARMAFQELGTCPFPLGELLLTDCILARPV